MGALAKSIRGFSGENSRVILSFERRHGNQDSALFAALGDEFVWKKVQDMSKYDPRYTNAQERILIYEICLKNQPSK